MIARLIKYVVSWLCEDLIHVAQICTPVSQNNFHPNNWCFPGKERWEKMFITSAPVTHLFNNISEAPGSRLVTENLKINETLN